MKKNKFLKQCIQQLKEAGLIHYNSVISVDLLEDLFNMPRQDLRFMGYTQSLRQMIETEGYFCCGWNQNKGFKILSFGEMPRKNNRFKQRENKLKERRYLAMSNANTDGVSERELNKHYHELNKVVNELSQNVSLLRKYLK